VRESVCECRPGESLWERHTTHHSPILGVAVQLIDRTPHTHFNHRSSTTATITTLTVLICSPALCAHTRPRTRLHAAHTTSTLGALDWRNADPHKKHTQTHTDTHIHTPRTRTDTHAHKRAHYTVATPLQTFGDANSVWEDGRSKAPQAPQQRRHTHRSTLDCWP
jgi:hypothetical protein